MGRPINKKYFANTNAPYDDAQTGGPTGQGGEGISTVTTPSNYSEVNSTYTAFPSLSVTGPNLPGGTSATVQVVWEILNGTVVNSGTNYISALTTGTEIDAQASVAPVLYLTQTGGNVTGLNFAMMGTDRGEFITLNGASAPWSLYQGTGTNATMDFNFRVKSINVVTAGSGYTTAPTFYWTSATAGQSLPTVPTATLSSSYQNGITVYAYVPGGSSGVIGDIMKQESSRRYLVRTAQGQGQCLLVTTSTLTAGQMYITASDVLGNTYYVDKLTSRKARLYQKTLTTGTFEFSNATLARWSLAAATTGTVQIANA